MNSATNLRPVLALERLVIDGVAVTASAIAETAPDLTFLQWRAIVVLADAPDGVPVGELARQLGSKLPATSRLLGRLRRRDLVVSRKAQADRRVTTVELTDTGRHIWKRIVDRRRADLEAIVRASGLDASGARALERVASGFSQVAVGSHPPAVQDGGGPSPQARYHPRASARSSVDQSD